MEGTAGSADGFVDVFWRTSVDGCDFLLVAVTLSNVFGIGKWEGNLRWVYRSYLFAIGRLDPFIVDEQTGGLLVSAPIGGSKLDV